MRVLVIAAHPDDEVLGCGGAILRHVSEGDEVSIAILGEGMMARANGRNDGRTSEAGKRLREAALEVSRALGAKEFFHHDFPDNRMDQVPLLDIVKIVEIRIGKWRPDIIYTHHQGDLNVDHGIVARAVTTATRPLSSKTVSEVYAFEVPSSTEWAFGMDHGSFKPNHFKEISSYLERKIQAMALYQTEMSPFPHPRSPEAISALAMFRGSQSGLRAAEGFMLLRKIVPEENSAAKSVRTVSA